MSDTPDFSATPPVPARSEQSVAPIRYKTIWCLNALMTVLAIGFYTLTSMATSDFLVSDLEGSVFMAMISLTWSLPVVGIGTAIFFWTKRILLKKPRRASAFRAWLGGPAWAAALLLIAFALWKCLPQQRLKTICKGHTLAASDIRVVGATGLQLAEWLAVFTLQPVEFEGLVHDLALEPISPEDFVARRDNLGMLGSKTLTGEWPGVASTNLWCFRWLYTGGDGNQHGDIHA
jgi:hypothetical protein